MRWQDDKSDDYLKLVREISTSLNKRGIDNDLNTPDYILAQGVVLYLQSLLRIKLVLDSIEIISEHIESK